ncbi:TPA: hypothetical protein ACWX1I_003569 [Elizabethkingia anophelis]
MDILFSSLHHIDIINNQIEHIPLDINQENLVSYIEGLVNEIVYNPSKRSYKFKTGDTQVKSSLTKILENNDNIESIVYENNKRLLEKESSAQKDLDKKNLSIEIQRGSLLHLYFEDIEDNYKKIIICKVEHDEILEEIKFSKVRGLNTRKKVFKAILIVFNKENHDLHSIHVYDKVGVKYWWDGFLELDQVYTDAENTSKSLDQIDKVLNGLKKNFPADHLVIRNSIILHYRANERIDYINMLNELIFPYNPFNKDFPKKELYNKLEKLGKEEKFDTQFGIDIKSINKRVSNKIPLGNNLFLDFYGPLKNNIDKIIYPSNNINGNLGIQIITPEGYDFFKDLNPNNIQ